MRNEKCIDVCVKEYEKSYLNLLAFYDSAPILSGSIIYKNTVRKPNGKSYNYTQNFWLVTEHINGKKYIRKKYIPDKELPYYKILITEIKQNKLYIKNILHEISYWENILKQFIDIEALKDSIHNKHKLLSDIQEHRLLSNNISPDYDVVTTLGDKVRSKNECILANLLFTYDIPYYYEKELQIKTVYKTYYRLLPAKHQYFKNCREQIFQFL